MHHLLRSQLAKVTDAAETVDLPQLLALVGDAYDAIDREQRRSERTMSVLVEEVEELNDALRLHVERLKEQNTRFAAALENMTHGLAMFSAENRLIVCNRLFAQIYRLPAETFGPGTRFDEVLAHWRAAGLYPSGRAQEEEAAAIAATTAADTTTRISELADGRIVSASYQSMDGGGWVCTVQDITLRQRDQERIYHMSRHDALTDLPNRLLFQETIDAAAARMQRGESIALLCLDLDHFKSVNDTLGHPVGDSLLVQVAQRLKETTRSVDMVARLGGDEFAIIQTGCNPMVAPGMLAQRLIDVVSQPYEIDGHLVVVGTSIGIAIGPADGQNAGELLKNADLALYRAKGDGRGNYRFFVGSMDAIMQARRTLELDLRAAVKLGQFELYYQPVLDLESNEVGCCEALLRWNHPTRGQVPPSEFVPLAEETGLIAQIGDWVLKQACRDAAIWPSDVRVAVNLSPVQLKNQRFVETVVAALESAGLPPQRLELEITEALLLQDTDANISTLTRLRALGVRIAMDDFGTGYSCLSYLRTFPFDKIKIDRSFLSDIESRQDAIAIVRAVSGIGASLGMAITAEGVETEGQLARILAEGCTEAQGYLFSTPQPVAAIAAILRDVPAARRRIAEAALPGPEPRAAAGLPCGTPQPQPVPRPADDDCRPPDRPASGKTPAKLNPWRQTPTLPAVAQATIAQATIAIGDDVSDASKG